MIMLLGRQSAAKTSFSLSFSSYSTSTVSSSREGTHSVIMDDDRSSSLSPTELQENIKSSCRLVGAVVDSTESLPSDYQLPPDAADVGASFAVAHASTDEKDTKLATNRKKSSPPQRNEKRLRNFRNTCSRQTQARIDRAKTQRLYLVQRGEVTEELECDFIVLGSTGNVYTVHIGRLPTCTCPDHQRGHLCKHILFIFLKVIGLEADSKIIYQAALVESELRNVFACMEERRVGGVVLANEQVRTMYAASLEEATTPTPPNGAVQRKALQDYVDCPICFDAMVETGIHKLTYCRAMCGTNFHEDCIRRWLGQNRNHPTCPNCRQPWQATNANTTTLTNEGYTNLGKLQGQPSQRDTSTYFSWSPDYHGHYNKRRRR